nr:DUF2971 domain-containing protein [Mesorhizobium sp.]
MDINELLSGVFSPDVRAMEARFDGASLYKFLYFDSEEGTTRYLTDPTLKFTQKSGLNDPFELTRRWKDFGSVPTYDIFQKIIQISLEEKLSNTDYIYDELVNSKEFHQSGMSSQQLRARLSSTEARGLLIQLTEQIRSQLPYLTKLFFGVVADQFDEQIEKIVSKMGILSLTEAIDNRALWSLYANSWRGFAIELDPQHDFLFSLKEKGGRRSILHKVFYRDDRIPDFWHNPHYLFSVKNTEYSFEREWRIIRKLDDCTKISIAENREIFVVNTPPGLIRSVIFGYNYDSDMMNRQIELLHREFPSLKFYRAIADISTGSIALAGVSL